MVNEKLQHSPSTSRHADRSDEMGMGWTSESFCEYVGAVVLGGNIRDFDIFAGDVISNMEVRDVDMFCTCVELVIMRIRYGGLVVAKDFDCTGRGEC